VGGKFGGALLIVWGGGFFMVGRNPSRLVQHRHGDACGCHRSFLKGLGCTPSPPPPRTGGNPRTCPGNNVIIVAFLIEGVAW
jgi:hypothetical protein